MFTNFQFWHTDFEKSSHSKFNKATGLGHTEDRTILHVTDAEKWISYWTNDLKRLLNDSSGSDMLSFNLVAVDYSVKWMKYL